MKALAVINGGLTGKPLKCNVFLFTGKKFAKIFDNLFPVATGMMNCFFNIFGRQVEFRTNKIYIPAVPKSRAHSHLRSRIWNTSCHKQIFPSPIKLLCQRGVFPIPFFIVKQGIFLSFHFLNKQ